MATDSQAGVAHTPGPWKADTNLGCKRISAKPFRGQQHRQAKRFEVACTPGLHDESEDLANARLIASAPDLLEALTDLRDWMMAVAESDHPLIEKADAAISHATGKDSA
jgi:hypothetical protein